MSAYCNVKGAYKMSLCIIFSMSNYNLVTISVGKNITELIVYAKLRLLGNEISTTIIDIQYK